MARHVNKMLTMPVSVIKLGEALAAKYTSGNFSKLVRMLIEERAKADKGCPRWVAKVEQAQEPQE